MKAKRTVSLILALLLLSSTFLTGCSENGSNADETNPSNSETTADSTEIIEEETEMTRANTPDDLPELNYNNETVTILARDKAWFEGELYVEERTGDVLTDAVYDRDVKVEERLGVTIDYELATDTNSAVNLNVTSGIDLYSIHAGSAVDTVQYGVNGNYYNLLGDYPEYLNLDQPWWSQYYTEQSEISGTAFFATGDLFFSLIKLSFVTFVNTRMLNDLHIDNLFDIVRSGEWTIDKQMEFAAMAYEDTNGNGEADAADKFGTSMGGYIGLDVYWSAFDLSIITKDAEGIPTFDMDQEKMAAVIEKLNTYYTECDYVYTPPANDDKEQDDIAAMLAADRMLFSPLRIMHTDQIRDMESDFALIPLPKWNEEQDNYYTYVHDQYSIAGIPLSVKNPSMVSAVMEAMAAESYRYVTPAYYDIVLNGRYLRDPNSAEMLDIAMEGIKIDFGWIYTYSLSSCSQEFLRALLYDDRADEFSSVYKSRQKVLKKVVEKMVDGVIKLKEDR